MNPERAQRFIPPLIFLGAAGVAAWRAAGFPQAAGGVPGPALAPLLLAALLAVAALGLLAVETRAAREEKTCAPIPWLRLGAVLGTVAAYVFLMPLAGFLSSTALFLYACLRLFGHRGGVHAWAFAVAAAWILYGVFAVAMGIPLPGGWIG